MRQTIHLKNSPMMYFLSFFLFIFCSGCEDNENSTTPYFKLKLNGVNYETFQPDFLTPGSGAKRGPIANYNLQESKSYFSFYTDISPKKESSTSYLYYLRFYYFMDKPLVVGEKYCFSILSEEDKLKQFENLIYENISFVSLSLREEPFGGSYGTGSFEITQINEDNTRAEGIVEFQFASPLKESQQITLVGEFRANFSVN